MDELKYDRYHKNADQIFRIITETKTTGERSLLVATPPPLAQTLVNDFPEVVNAVRFIRPAKKEVLIGHKDRKFYENRFFFADNTIFDIFTFPLVKGNHETALQEPYSVVITEEMAEKYFGNEEPLGKVINFDNRDDYKITGILRNVPHNSHFRFDFIASFKTLNHYFILPFDDWGSCALYTYLLIPEKFSPEEIEGKFPAFIRHYMGESFFIKGFHLQPLTSIHLHSNYRGEIEANSDMAYIYIFSAIAFLVLIIACINFINLSTACYMNRAKEVGMRKVLGADRSQIIKQFLGESVFLTFVALPIAIVLVELSLPTFNTLVRKDLDLNYFNNIPSVLVIIGINLFIGLASGIYPSLFLSAFQPIKVLRGMFKSGPSRSMLRSGLVLAQFAVSILLMACTVIMNNQLNYIRNKKLGFDKEHVVVLPIKEASTLQLYQSTKNELLRYPTILNVTVSSDVPGRSGVNSNPFLPEGFERNDKISIHNMRVDYDFMETLGIDRASQNSKD